MRRLAAVALAAVLLTACTSGGGGGPPAGPAVPRGLPPPPAGGFDPPVTVVFDGAPPLRAEVARRPDQRARGLMQRPALPEGTGMIFLFPEPTTTGFYMFGTLVPLSIAYVDRGRVVSTAEMQPCRALQAQECPTYPPAGPYTSAVEAPGGFFPRYGVQPGTAMRVAPQGS